MSTLACAVCVLVPPLSLPPLLPPTYQREKRADRPPICLRLTTAVVGGGGDGPPGLIMMTGAGGEGTWGSKNGSSWLPLPVALLQPDQLPRQ